MTQRQNTSFNPLGSFSSIIFLLLFFVALYYIATGFFWLLSLIAPVLLIATLVIDYTVVTDFGKWLVDLVKKNWVNSLYIIGILVALSFIGINAITGILFPAITTFLFGKAMLKRRLKSMKQDFETKTQGEFVDYEEVDSKAPPSGAEDADIIEELDLEELPPRRKPIQETRKPGGNAENYDQFFE